MRLYSSAMGGAWLLAASSTAAQPALTAAEPPAIVDPGTGPRALPPPRWQVLYPEAPSPYRNNAMRIAGIVLTSLAGTLALAGVIATSIDLGSPHGNGMLMMALGVPLFASSTVPAGIGIPLWVVGGSPPKTSPWVGPGGFRLAF